MGEKAKILILGTYHFGLCGEHLMKIEVEDVTKNKKQLEIIKLVEALARFKPNKIAIELSKEKEVEINEEYLKYCSGEFTKNDVVEESSEIVQVAFRLGKLLGHKQIYPLDYSVGLPIEEMLMYAESNNKQFFNNFMSKVQGAGEQMNSIINNNEVIDVFRYLNSHEKFNNDHSDLYLSPVQVGAGDNYCGSKTLVEWYRRNIYIFSNLQAIAKEDDRVLVIYGADHCKILRDLVNDYNEYQLVDALDYL
ncbi:DUF5694 domain-containing protein [Clostridium tunisiense]|uniref:DUF5694 domain-containing protein n=1 Tax=Clostridium tunisiense TaxID=219748 RepID=UPI000304A221|nr:DUF5694 domain-containing protein [Clostridium tunisiense]